jgi:hypothetical protein
VRIGQASAKTAGRLQRVLEAHRDVPPVEHDRGMGQRLALQPPQPGIAIAQHRRRRVRMYSGHGERLLERIGRNRGTVARESEAGLGAMGVDHLARHHLKVALLLLMPTADIAAIQTNHDWFGWLRRDRLCRLGGVWLHNVLPTRNVLFRTVPAFGTPLIGSNSDKRTATWPNGANAAYRAVTYASSGATVAASRSNTAKLVAPLESWQGQASRRRTRTGTSPSSERNVAE